MSLSSTIYNKPWILPATGVGLGALLGSINYFNKPKKKRKIRQITGPALGLGYIGLQGHNAINNTKGAFRSGYRSYQYRPSSKSAHDVMPEMKSVKTKADANSIYRRYAMNNHPDKGGSAEKMQKINDAMKAFRDSSEWNKLAFLFRYGRF